MFKNAKAFCSFSVNDVKQAKQFYGQTLGLEVSEVMTEHLMLKLGNGQKVFVYGKPNHTPASFTVLNFPVDSVERAVDALKERGVRFESYSDEEIKTDARGIHTDDEAKIAWFKDPAGNVLAVLQSKELEK
jgi:predicted enzyme related to lactoylglutathione lyase